MPNPTPIDSRAAGLIRRKGRKQLVPRGLRPLILVVEDDAEMRRMLASALRRMDYDVVEAADGDAALGWLGPGVLEGRLERMPSLIVSDIRLPYFSGLDILEGMQLVARHIPVILITGFGDAETHAAARRLGADRVLDKPFEMSTLLAAVRSALRRDVGEGSGPAAGGSDPAAREPSVR